MGQPFLHKVFHTISKFKKKLTYKTKQPVLDLRKSTGMVMLGVLEVTSVLRRLVI